MSLLQTALHHPRRLFLRRALFQVHLWLGLVLALWVVLIGLSGSALVFEEELTRWTVAASPATLPSPAEQAAIPLVLAHAEKSVPSSHAIYITTPTAGTPFFQVWLQQPSGKEHVVSADARSGSLLPVRHPALAHVMELTHDFHVYLLAGPRGLVANGVLAAGLLAIALSGIALWWPGVRSWARGLRLHLSRRPGHSFNWRRLNFDLHHAVGFWTLAWSLVWALSSIYFGFPALTERIVAHISPIVAMHPPALRADTAPATHPPLPAILAAAQHASPGRFLSGISLPSLPGANYVVTLDTGRPGDFSHRDFVTISPRTGNILSVWHYGQNRTLSDWLLWIMYPLHYGTLWGSAWKLLWATLGLSLPLLAVSGFIMYWNRYLRRRWSNGGSNKASSSVVTGSMI